jgi:hypothetical protein
MHLIRPDHCRCVRSCQAQPELWRPDRFVALVSLLGILWLWRDTGDVGRIADHAQSTFWYVLPSLPMFLVLPAMLRAGVGFWSSLGANCLLTMLLYLAMAWGLAKFGISL